MPSACFFRRTIRKLYVAILPLVWGLSACSHAPINDSPTAVEPLALTSIERQQAQQAQQAPVAPREFRAAWVATVGNIDWPSRKGLGSEQQKKEITEILDHAAQLKLNAIILQVRPSADAIYPSAIEPWSEFLSGSQGMPPQPWYDPLQMWIEQAHARGIELHAWFNPYRAKMASANSPLAPNHIARHTPTAVKEYDNMLWMDPAEAAAKQQTLAVILDVVRRYDIDGVHMDDYFYPYPAKASNGEQIDFPDEAAWNQYQQSGGKLTRPDWRRQHVNELIETIYHGIRKEKSWVKFGISPFGIGKPDRRPEGIVGFSQYDQLYADVEHWLDQGWMDYLTPQLYWPLQQKGQEFGVLQTYWQTQNTKARHLWPGLYTSRINDTDKSWSAEEILNQVDLTRSLKDAGHVHFSMVALLQDRKQIRSKLINERYQSPALVPASPWLNSASLAAMAAPQIALSSDQKSLSITIDAKSQFHLLAIWKRYGTQWRFSVQASSQLHIDLQDDAQLGAVHQVVVSGVDRYGRESGPCSVDLVRPRAPVILGIPSP